MLLKLLLVGAGGGLGSMARFVVAAMANRFGGHFPLGTLVVNLVGCALAGAAMAWVSGGSHAVGLGASAGGGGAAGAGAAADATEAVRTNWRLFLVVGVCGGFTTYSAFAYETFAAAAGARTGVATWNIVLTTLGCLACVWAGWRVVDHLMGGG